MILTIERVLAAVAAFAMYGALCAFIFYVQWRKRHRNAQDASALSSSIEGANSWLVAYASQTGFAEELAWQTARLLHTAGLPARIASFATLKADDLVNSERALFLASTYGEGDQPDNAMLFTRKLMNGDLRLDRLRYGLLALGDKSYANFCGFGRRLDQWLQMQGAQSLFERIEVNGGDQAALRDWQYHLSTLAGAGDVAVWQAPAYQQWTLSARQYLNPGSAGQACFHIELQAPSGVLPDWQSGDLIQMRVPQDPQRPREYSIASVPNDGAVHLLVRQERHDDGSLGIASGWLTHHAQVGSTIEMRLRANRNFRLGENAKRPLILIGNGTGLAGLRSHIKARALVRQRRNWLIFGERNAAYDSYYRDEIDAWRASGVLERIDLAFSRDQAARYYVQDRLRDAADDVRNWVEADAAIYVCGSLDGMASGVEEALTEILGGDCVDNLNATGRYRRDVY